MGGVQPKQKRWPHTGSSVHCWIAQKQTCAAGWEQCASSRSGCLLLGGGAGWRCWVLVLGGAAGWRCWVAVLGAGAGWRCWVAVPIGHAAPVHALVLTLTTPWWSQERVRRAAGSGLGRAAAEADRAAFLLGSIPTLPSRHRRPVLDANVRELAPPQHASRLVASRLVAPCRVPLGGGDRCREKEPIVPVVLVQSADLARPRHVVADLAIAAGAVETADEALARLDRARRAVLAYAVRRDVGAVQALRSIGDQAHHHAAPRERAATRPTGNLVDGRVDAVVLVLRGLLLREERVRDLGGRVGWRLRRRGHPSLRALLVMFGFGQKFAKDAAYEAL